MATTVPAVAKPKNKTGFHATANITVEFLEKLVEKNAKNGTYQLVKPAVSGKDGAPGFIFTKTTLGAGEKHWTRQDTMENIIYVPRMRLAATLSTFEQLFGAFGLSVAALTNELKFGRETVAPGNEALLAEYKRLVAIDKAAADTKTATAKAAIAADPAASAKAAEALLFTDINFVRYFLESVAHPDTNTGNGTMVVTPKAQKPGVAKKATTITINGAIETVPELFVKIFTRIHGRYPTAAGASPVRDKTTVDAGQAYVFDASKEAGKQLALVMYNLNDLEISGKASKSATRAGQIGKPWTGYKKDARTVVGGVGSKISTEGRGEFYGYVRVGAGGVTDYLPIFVTKSTDKADLEKVYAQLKYYAAAAPSLLPAGVTIDQYMPTWGASEVKAADLAQFLSGRPASPVHTAQGAPLTFGTPNQAVYNPPGVSQ